MIGIDSNVLVRYVVQDDPVQSPKAAQLIESILTEENPGFVSIVTLVETVWVLKRPLRLTDAKIAGVLRVILRIESLVVEHEREVFAAMILLAEGRSSFSDALIGKLASRAGCTHTLTFDKRASRLDGFELLS